MHDRSPDTPLPHPRRVVRRPRSADLTIVDDIVTSVTVSGSATDHEAAEFQSRFASGVSVDVVGKELSSLSVTRVSGASLTSNGFNTALDDIRSQAA